MERIRQFIAETTSATALAEAAQVFGQQEDIPVLTIARTAPVILP